MVPDVTGTHQWSGRHSVLCSILVVHENEHMHKEAQSRQQINHALINTKQAME